MKVSYVVLYVDDAMLCRRFWIDQIGMVEKLVTQAGEHEVARVGFADQPFAFELVPLELMADNPDGLDLATPSLCFSVDDLSATRKALLVKGVEVTEIGSHAGMQTFAFSDPEGRWFAVAD
jgi:lactoylglutathione lyase